MYGHTHTYSPLPPSPHTHTVMPLTNTGCIVWLKIDKGVKSKTI